jgi:hypothetical protein
MTAMAIAGDVWPVQKRPPGPFENALFDSMDGLGIREFLGILGRDLGRSQANLIRQKKKMLLLPVADAGLDPSPHPLQRAFLVDAAQEIFFGLGLIRAGAFTGFQLLLDPFSSPQPALVFSINADGTLLEVV